MKTRRRDWTRLNQARACRDDSTNQFPTPEDVVRGMVDRYGRGLRGKKVHCFADSRDSWFYKVLKERFQELGLSLLVATEWVDGGRGRQVRFDGVREDALELADDGSLFGECSRATTAECDVVFTNPPFKRFSAVLGAVGKKDFVLVAPHLLPFKMGDYENQIVYRIARGEVLVEPKEFGVWSQGRDRLAKCLVISTIRPEPDIGKVDIELRAKYDPAVHKMFVDADTGKPTGIVNCDRLKDFPVDWPGLVAVPATALRKIANQRVHVNDVYGMRPRGGDSAPNAEIVDADGVYGASIYGKAELADVIDVRGFYGKGDFTAPFMETLPSSPFRAKLEDGRVPFQRLIVGLRRKR